MNYTKKKIEKLHDSGKKLKYLFFWGHKKHPSAETTSSCLSQWWPQRFTIDGIKYPTAEHFMMAEKARLFNDSAALGKIIESSSPAVAKENR